MYFLGTRVGDIGQIFIVLACVYGFYGISFLVVYMLGKKKTYPGQVLWKETPSGVAWPSMSMGVPIVNAGPSMGTSFVNPIQSTILQNALVTQQQTETSKQPQGAPPVDQEKLEQ